MTSEINLPDDEIDIRQLLLTLFRYKWYIIGITLAAMILVFVSTQFLMPRSYTAETQVIITQPLYTTNLESQIQGTPQTPEGGILKDLALANDLLWNVYTSNDVTTVIEKEISFKEFKGRISAKLVGTSNLFLAASSTESITAATIVNVWADQFSAQINSLYSVNVKALTLIEKEMLNAREKWDMTEQVLLAKLPDGIVETRKIELENKQYTLTAYLNKNTQLDLLTRDAQSLLQRLEKWDDNSQVSIEVQLSLIGLYQRAAGGLAGVQIQMLEPTTVGVRTVAEAKASLEALVASLDSQGLELMANLEQLKQEITSATLALESTQYQYTQLTTERDLALGAYQALSAQVEETRIDLARDDLVAKVASRGLPPEQPDSNRTLMKTMIVGVLAFVLSCFGVLTINWWKSPTPSKPVI